MPINSICLTRLPEIRYISNKTGTIVAYLSFVKATKMSFFKKRKHPLSFSPPVLKKTSKLDRKMEGPLTMDDSRFEIPSAILAAAVVAKSELTGEQLTHFAVDTQRFFMLRMRTQRMEDHEKGHD